MDVERGTDLNFFRIEQRWVLDDMIDGSRGWVRAAEDATLNAL